MSSDLSRRMYQAMSGDGCPRCHAKPMGMHIRGAYDGILFWKCLDCGIAWHRFLADDPRRERADSYVDAINVGVLI